ncbi:MAG: WbqC family protein [Tenacibaculum sp.]
MAVFIPLYFAPIVQYVVICQSKELIFECQDNFQKQTYRNRCYVYGANGRLSLNVPLKHKAVAEGRKKTKDVLIENNFNWQKQHFKSLQTAYKSSPFFEFFEDDLAKIFYKKYTFLHELNLDTHLFVADALQISSVYSLTNKYKNSATKDYRSLARAKGGLEFSTPSYVQIFDNKYGFIPNLSILDLLFMEGARALIFLKNISLSKI